MLGALATKPGVEPATLLDGRQLTRVVRDQAGRAATILSDVSISIRQGEFLALTGASGSGKSSLLYLLGLLDRPSAGALSLDGRDTTQLSDNQRAALRRAHLGFVFQFHFLLPELSVLENVALPIRRSRDLSVAEAADMAQTTLVRLGLGGLEMRKPSQLSGGQQQRVAIARAIANRPSLLLADEPTGSLDSVNANAVFEVFAQLAAERRMAIVMVTHEARFARQAARCIELCDGRIVEETQRGAGQPGARSRETTIMDRKLQ
jgi:lipoprotein-releasing system ATP-binding protein